MATGAARMPAVDRSVAAFCAFCSLVGQQHSWNPVSIRIRFRETPTHVSHGLTFAMRT